MEQNTKNSIEAFELLKRTSTSINANELPSSSFLGLPLHQYEGYWYRLHHLVGAVSAKSEFIARDDDIILASSMKTGTTWLKALIPMIINRPPGDNYLDNYVDPLVENHPNVLMPSLEIQIFGQNSTYDISTRPSPRLFRTHVPYTMLPDSVINSNCKIVYVTRDPKDTFVSLWHFLSSSRKPEEGPLPLEECFENFCNGFHLFGPFHDHVLGYWKEKLEKPNKILFVKYQDLKKDTRGEVKKLAAFLGRPFVDEKGVDQVVYRCSLERLKNLEVNKNGLEPWVGLPKSSYFRNDLVGESKKCLSKDMNDRLDAITLMKLRGSGLDLISS